MADNRDSIISVDNRLRSSLLRTVLSAMKVIMTPLARNLDCGFFVQQPECGFKPDSSGGRY